MIINPYIQFPGPGFITDDFSTLDLTTKWALYNNNATTVTAAATGGQLVFSIGAGSNVFELLWSKTAFDITDRFVSIEPIQWNLFNVNCVIGIWNNDGSKRTEATVSGGTLYYSISGGSSGNVGYSPGQQKIRISYQSSDTKYYIDYWNGSTWVNLINSTGNMDPTSVKFVCYPFSFGSSGSSMIVDNFDSNIPV